MRSSFAIVVLLTACVSDPDPGHQPAGVEKQRLDGLWSHDAIVIDADPATGVAVGDARSAEVRFDIGEHELVARTIDDERAVIRMRIDGHFDVASVTNPRTGETWTELREHPTDALWDARSHLLLNVGTQSIVDPDFVPLPLEAEPLEHFPDDTSEDLTWLPEIDDSGRATWSFLAHYDSPGGLVVVRHELERLAE